MKRELNNIIRKNVLPYLKGEYIVSSDMLIKLPIDSFLCGFYFEKSKKRKEEGFYIWTFVQPLFIPKSYIVFNIGQRIKNNVGNDFWKIEDMKNDSFLSKLEAALKFIDTKCSPEKLVLEYQISNRLNIKLIEALTYSHCYIKSSSSKEMLNKLIEQYKQMDTSIEWVKESINRALILTNEVVELGSCKNTLDKWRQQTLSNLGLQSTAVPKHKKTNMGRIIKEVDR